MSTLKDIAGRAKVSTATVSNVLNEKAYVSPKLRAQVMKAVQELNYHPDALARTLKTRKSKTVGMIIPDITNPFFPAVVRGAEDVLLQDGYTLILGNSDGQGDKEERYYRAFRSKRVDGMLMIVAPSMSAPDYLRRHKPADLPIVYVDRFHREIRADVVLADNIKGAHEAVSHLLDLGHRRIGIVSGPSELANARMRVTGYERALADRGVSIEKELVRTGRFDVQSGYEQTQALLKLRVVPTAIFISNALMMVGCLRALKQEGLRCPKDMSLVTFDDLEWFGLASPAITAVQQPVYELGSTAAELLLNRMAGRLSGPPRRRVLPTKLMIRESTRAVSADLGELKVELA